MEQKYKIQSYVNEFKKMQKFKEKIQRGNHGGIAKYPNLKNKKHQKIIDIEDSQRLKTHESTMSMGSSNFIQGSVNKGPFKKI